MQYGTVAALPVPATGAETNLMALEGKRTRELTMNVEQDELKPFITGKATEPLSEREDCIDR